MQDYLSKVFKQIVDFFNSLSPGRKLSLVGVGTAVAGGIAMLFVSAASQTYQPVMEKLSSEDSTNIIRVLRDKRIPFRVDDGGRTISVPPENVQDLRLELATLGMPQSGVIGYEVFDKQTLGTTSFVQQINQKRALEGELIRTINEISGVRRSRVHLALPKKSTFVEDQRKPTASVVVDLEPGTQLTDRQVFGIGNLVARAVEGMDIDDVAVVDSNGKVLSRSNGDPISAVTATQHDFRQKLEKSLESRIEEMLARVVGEGRVVARVSADLDFSEVSETQTLYDAEGSAVHSVQRDTKTMEGSRPGSAGLAGAASNQPGAPAAGTAQIRNDTKTSSEVTNYDVPQTIRRTARAPGSVRKLNVAVLVDGKTVKTAAADGTTESKVEAWPAEKLKEFEAVVSTAAGIDRTRGDTLEIKNMEFTREDFTEATRLADEATRQSYVKSVISYSVVGLLILLFFLFVVRPFIKWVTDNTIDSVDSFLPQTIEELEKLQKTAPTLPGLEEVPQMPDQIDPEKVENEMMKEKIVSMVEANPHKAAMIIGEWLHGGGGGEAAAKGDGKSKTA